MPIMRHLGAFGLKLKPMPLSLNFEPTVFSKLGEAVIQELRELGILVSA